MDWLGKIKCYLPCFLSDGIKIKIHLPNRRGGQKKFYLPSPKDMSCKKKCFIFSFIPNQLFDREPVYNSFLNNMKGHFHNQNDYHTTRCTTHISIPRTTHAKEMVHNIKGYIYQIFFYIDAMVAGTIAAGLKLATTMVSHLPR